MLERRERRGTSATVVPGDEHNISMGLRHACSDGTDANLGNQLDVNSCLVICVLQIVDELRQILDRINVVMGRRRNQSYAWSRMTRLRDPRIHLVTWKLTALAGLCALSHLDLQIISIDEVLARDTEATRSNLLDCGTPRISVWQRDEALGIFSALTSIGFATEAIHRNGEVLMSFSRDRAVRHCTS
ncbi:unannotated protein [freshwater metagenome]|uniref:Unannotated protein n=1 Tax=freshwater metagenome TaxID=449393 RepID=A0A6J6CFB0_9ZZZZ